MLFKIIAYLNYFATSARRPSPSNTNLFRIYFGDDNWDGFVVSTLHVKKKLMNSK